MKYRKQKGYLQGIGKAITALMVCLVLAAMPLGWLIIEGVIWLFHNVHIGIAP